MTLEELEEAADRGDWEQLLYPIDAALMDLPAMVVDPLQEEAIGYGKPVPLSGSELQKGDEVRAYSRDGELIALMSYDAVLGQLQPVRVLAAR